MECIVLKIRRLTETATLPEYATDGAACFDLHVDLGRSEADAYVSAGSAATLHTGLAFEIPRGWCMKIYSRSGHGFKNDTRLANCVGVIDSDYRGEVMVRLTNDGNPRFDDSMHIKHGDRIAQAMLEPTYRAKIVEVESLSETARGSGGFGSTGR